MTRSQKNELRHLDMRFLTKIELNQWVSFLQYDSVPGTNMSFRGQNIGSARSDWHVLPKSKPILAQWLTTPDC